MTLARIKIEALKIILPQAFFSHGIQDFFCCCSYGSACGSESPRFFGLLRSKRYSEGEQRSCIPSMFLLQAFILLMDSRTFFVIYAMNVPLQRHQ